MPIPVIAETIRRGPELWAWAVPLVRLVPVGIAYAGLKWFFGGARNRAERTMHGKVVLVTGGTSGIGASVVRELAQRGAQVVLLTRHAASDPFVAEYVEDVRAATGNELVYAEQVDLGSLHSIRQFATRWIDNVPPRRLDMVLLCAGTVSPRFAASTTSRDGLEPCWAVNYLANFHLLSILSPALRAQPPERDVRVVLAACGAYARGDLARMTDARAPLPPGRELATSKLALMVFARAFQRHLDDTPRPDKEKNNTRVVMVDPGLTRTPGTRRWLSMGSLWGLLVYLLLWPLVSLVLKSPDQGAQSFLTAAMEAEIARKPGGRLLRECRDVEPSRPEIDSVEVAERLWRFSENQIIALEKEGAAHRAKERKANGTEKMNQPAPAAAAEPVAATGKKEQRKASKRK